MYENKLRRFYSPEYLKPGVGGVPEQPVMSWLLALMLLLDGVDERWWDGPADGVDVAASMATEEVEWWRTGVDKFIASVCSRIGGFN